MAFLLKDRVKETTTTTGTGSISMGGAVTGFRAFSDAFSTGDTTYYTIDGGSGEWEVGLGTLTSGTPWTMARTSVLASSNSGSAVNFSSGTKNVWCDAPAVMVSPGGSTTQVQYNNAGAFAGDSGFTYSSTNKAITLGGATVTASAPVLDLSQTWNSGGTTFTGLKLNVTDTASASASLLMDLQKGGVSQFSVSKAGNASILGEATITSTINFGFGGSLSATIVGVSNNLFFGSDAFVFRTKANANATYVVADAANTLALRNSTSGQLLRIYETYTDASNYSRLTMGYSSGASAYVIYQEAAGTGSGRGLIINSGSGTAIQFWQGGSTIWSISSAGNIVAATDNVSDIGGSGANRPRTGYFGTRLQAPVFRADNDYTVATLPTGVVGNIARVTDASAPAVGSTVTGGGAAAALVWYNGTNYTVIGV